jgi:C-terminal processing protease CtpA/Prc
VNKLPAKLPTTESSLIGVILDLRGTLGGSIEEASALARLFIKKGVLVQVVGNANDLALKKINNPLAADARLVILVDEGTGHAAEIIAAALQERHRAVVMGKQTCGLGAVYHVVRDKTYGDIRLPKALLLTPDGKALFNRGVLPDIPAKYAEATVREWASFRHEVLAFLKGVKAADLEWPGKKKEKQKDESEALLEELTKDNSDSSAEKQKDKDGTEDKDDLDPKLQASVEEQILENYPLVRKFDRPFVRALNLLVSMNVFFSDTKNR